MGRNLLHTNFVKGRKKCVEIPKIQKRVGVTNKTQSYKVVTKCYNIVKIRLYNNDLPK